MSGGSFDYLFIDMQDPDQLYSVASKLQRMKEYCAATFPDAVPYIDDMLQFIQRLSEEYLVKGARIADLLRAVEWEASGDYNADQVREVLNDLKAKSE
jgi:hypothetical protein